MVGAISSTASSLLGSTSSSSNSSSSNSTSADIQAQIDALQQQASNEKNVQKKKAIDDQITALKAQLDAAKAVEKLKESQPNQSTAQSLLSGENQTIGTSNFDATTPFGKRAAWV